MKSQFFEDIIPYYIVSKNEELYNYKLQ